jgi:PAS domain S-box-containing protein
MRALLVVQDRSLQDRLLGILTARGWRLACTASWEAGIEAFREFPVPLVVLEYGSGSVEACAAFRSTSSGRAAYILAIAEELDQGAVRALVEAGVDDVAALSTEADPLPMRLQVAEARVEERAGSGVAVGPGDHAPLAEMERKLHVQQAFLEGLFESAPEGVVILDADNRIVRINSEFTRMFGYAAGEAMGMPLNDLIVPENLRPEGVELDGGVRRGERIMTETTRRHRDGHLIDVSVLATTIHVNGPVGAFAIYRDITERKQQEAALRQSEARYRALFDQSPVGVFLCDRDLRITHCNEYLTQIVGITYRKIVGANLLSLRDGRLLPGIRIALGGQPAFYEGPYRARTGKRLHVSVQYAPLRDEEGEVIGGIGVIADITERVEAQRRLHAQAAEMERVNAALRERTLELEAAMQARSRLYTAMNHELRTPIASILLYQELLIAGSLGKLTDEQTAAIEHSHMATRHLHDLVRDILDLSKIEAGKVSVQPVEVSLKQLLEELMAAVAPLTERHGSRLRLRVEDDVGSVITDPQRLRQILLNFVSNAAKYGRQRPIEIRCRAVDAGLCIEVVDQGIGIAHENLGHIFEDFVQLGREGQEGTGLGLAISRRLAELLGGTLEVESEPEVGSTFRLLLPHSVEAVEVEMRAR